LLGEPAKRSVESIREPMLYARFFEEGFGETHSRQNDPDDRAGESKFSIRKRPIHRFGPSDCSSIFVLLVLLALS
jgi:hypothetical protein